MINFSLLKNIQSFIPRTKPTKTDELDKFKDPTHLFDGIRILAQINIMTQHILIMGFHDLIVENFNSRFNQDYSRLFFDHFVKAWIRYCLVLFSLFNGFAAGRWFFRQIKLSQSFAKITFRFYLERFLITIPIYYLFIITFIYYTKFIVFEELAKHNITDVCVESIAPHMLFYMNFVHDYNLVSFNYFEYFKIILVILKCQFKCE